MYAAPISAKSYAFCAALPMVSQVTSTIVIEPSGIQSVLPTPYQAQNNHGPLVDCPRQHIKHAHSQS